MTKPVVVIATPCYGGLVSHRYMLSVIRLMAAVPEVEFRVQLNGGDALITRARATLVSAFLAQPDATHLLFIDADIAFEPDQFRRLFRAGHEVSAATYPIKAIDWDALPARTVAGEPLTTAGLGYVGELCVGDEAARDGSFATARYVGTGFLLIRRNALEQLCAAHPELGFTKLHARDGEQPPGERHYALFDCLIDPETGIYLSEDYAFCRRWRALGGRIWLDLESRLTHIGPTAFDGDAGLRFRSTEDPTAF